MAARPLRRERAVKSTVWSHRDPVPQFYRPALEGQRIERRRPAPTSKRQGLLLPMVLGLIGALILWNHFLKSGGNSLPKEASSLANSSGLVDAPVTVLPVQEPANSAKPKPVISNPNKPSPANPALIKPPSELLASEVSKKLERAAGSEKKQLPSFDPALAKKSSNPESKTENKKAKNKKSASSELVASAKSLAHKVTKGETLLSIFSRYGLSPQEAHSVDGLLRESKEIGHKLQPGQELEFFKGEKGELDSLEMGIDKVRSAKISRKNRAGQDVNFGLVISKKPIIKKELVAEGTIRSNLSEAAEQNGVSYVLVDEFVDIFANKIRFHKDLRQGDKFSLIYKQEALKDGTLVGAGSLIAGGIRVGNKSHLAFKVTDKDGQNHFVDRRGEIISNSFLRYPLKFSRISSYFSHSRLHPILKRRKPHHGVDFAAPSGTPVRSVADGKVTFAGRKGPNGIMVKLSHGPRYGTAYLHLSTVSKGLRVGSLVERGEIIGKVGSTGRSTGPHLDYRFYDRGRSVDPLKVKLPTIDYNKKLVFDRKKHAQQVKKIEKMLSHKTVSAQAALKSEKV